MFRRASVWKRVGLIGLAVIFVVSGLFSTTPVFAATKTWDGGGLADTNWTTCTNWNNDTCPVEGVDIVTFDATAVTDVTLTADVSVTTFTIAATYLGTIHQGVYNITATSFSQAGGIFTGGSGSFDLNGGFTLTGGVFTAPSGAMTVSGAWTHTVGGTFTHNNGRVTADGSGNVTWDVTTTETFYDLTLAKTGSLTVTVASTDTLKATHDLVLSDGKFGTGTVELTGATGSVSSTWDGAVTGGAMLIDGVGTQTFTMNGGGLQPGVTFTVNNADATVVGGGTGTLTFGGTTLTSGTMNLTGYDASWSGAVAIGGGTMSCGTGTKTFGGTFTISSGTFNGNTGTIDYNSSITISGGTYNATSGATTAATNWTHTAGGTFNHNNGSMTADTGGGATWNFATNETFYDFTVNKGTGVSFLVSSGDTLIASNSLTLTDGKSSTGTLELTGPTGSVASTWDGGTSTSTVLIDGVGTQTFTLNGGGLEPGVTFTINNANATVGVAGVGTILTYITNLQAGTFDTTGADYSSNNAFTISGGTFTSGTGLKLFGGAFAISSGTFNGNSATIDVNSTLTISGGAFNASTGTMTVASTWTHAAGGTFTHNSGTVTADGNAATWDVTVTETFGSFIVNKSDNTALTITAGDTLLVTGTLTYTEGKTLGGTIQANGNVAFASALDASTTSLVFGGSGTQTFDGGGTSTWDGSMTLNGTSTVQLTAGFTMNAANKSIAVASGTLDLNGQSITVNGTSATFIFDSGATLQLQGGETITANTNYPQLDAGSTVKYTGTSGPYTLKDYTYHHLTIAGGASSVFTLAANESFAGNVTLTTGILSQGGFTMAVVGTFSNDATLRRLQVEAFTGTMDVNSGTVEYVGDNDASAESITITDFDVAGTDYYNLLINDVNATKDTFTIGATTTIVGTLQVTSSEFQQSTQTLTPANIIVDGGTLTGGSGAITVSGAVTISSGTFVGTSNTLTVSGAWTHTAGGTFTHNSGTVAFTGSSVTIDVASTESFSALTINKTSGQTLTVASGDALVVAGVLTLTDGAFATGSITAQGNIVVGAGWDAAGAGAINATGTGVVTLDASGNLDNPLTINKAGGSFTLASAYTLDHANADFTLTLGTFSTGGFTLTTSSGSDIALNGGTFNASSATLTIAGGITVAGATMNGNTSTGTISGAFLLSSGAYNGDTSTPTLSGGLTISGGVFTASSGVTTVSGAFTHTAGGTFTHNSGTMTFTGNSATVDVATSETFSALTLNKTTGQTLTIATGDTLVMVGTLTLTDGVADGNNFEAQGSVAIGAGYDGGTASLKFSGGAAQSLDLTGVENIFNGDIEVAKSAETLTLGSALTMDAVGQDLTITSGTFSTSGTNYGLTIAGDLLMNGGTTALNGSTVAVTGTARLNGGSVTSSGGSMTAGTLQVTSGTYAQGTQTVAPTALVVDGGTFTGGGGSMTAGSITLSLGTLTAPSGTLSVSGGWTHTAGGTFTHNSGTVAFTGSSATIDVASTESFSAVTINKTDGQTLTIASDDALVVAGTLTLTDGAFATGSVTAQGNIVVGVGWDAAGGGAINATGTGIVTLDASDKLDNPLTINKAGGSFTLASAYTLDHANADFTLTLGTFATGDFTLSTSSGSDIALNGGTFNAGASTLTIAGGLTVAGATMNGNTSTGTISGAFAISSGAYNGNTSTTTFSGGVTISGGTLTASSGTTTVSGAWTHTAGGTFTHNSGTVALTGSSATVDVATSETFSALTINKTDGQTLTVSSGDTLIATGTLTLTNGTWATGSVQAQGNVAVPLTWDANGSGTLEFAGAGVQTFDLTGATAAFDNPVNVNKSGGTLTLASAYTLDAATADFTVTLGAFSTGNYALATSSGSDITIAGGTFNCGSSTMTIAGALAVNGGTFDCDTATPTFSGAVTVAGGTYTSDNATQIFSSTFAISSGAFSGSANGDTFAGGLTISGGTFTASDATTTVSGGWTHTAGGTFTHNSGTVSFTGAAATIDVATTETFSTLTISKNNAATLTIASGDSLVVIGTLTLTNGAVGTGTLQPQGGVSIGAGFDGGNAGMTFAGSAAQTLSATGATDKFDGDIAVAKTTETVTLGSALVMDASGQDLTVTTGGFSTSGTNYALTVAGNVAVNGGTFTLNGSTVDLNGNLTVGGGTLNMGTATIALAGDATYTSGTMTPGTSTVTLDGTNQAISGATTWNNLTKTVVLAATLTLPASTVTTILGTMNFQGAASQLLSLRSSSTGTQTTLTPTTVTAPTYLDVKDNIITKSTTCLTSTSGCVNSLNNSGWTFMRSSGSLPIDGNAPETKTISMTAPNGGESYTVGEVIAVTWSSTGVIDRVNVLFSSNQGLTWTVIASNILNTGATRWTVENVPTSNASMKVEAWDGLTAYRTDASDAFFSILSEQVETPETEESDLVADEPPSVADPVAVAEVASRVAALPEVVTVHGLVKLADDGNLNTQNDSAIYYVGADGRRHAFPNEAIYKSWFCDFSGVQEVAPGVLSAMEFGKNITYRPGLKLVKFQTNPKTYAVDTFGVLRWIETEELARALYGNAWAQKIDDISDAFFGNYSFGSPIQDVNEFNPDAEVESVVFPSDSMEIPGYTSESGSGLQCS